MGDPTEAVRHDFRKRAWVVALTFAMIFPTLMTVAYFIVLARPAGSQEGNLAMQLVYTLGKTLQFTFPVLAVLVLERRFPRPGPVTGRGVTIGVAFGIAVGLAIAVLYFGLLQGTAIFARLPALLSAKLYEFNLATPAGFIGLGIFISLIHSLMEEYYWRWFVFSYLRRLMPLWPAITLSSLGFMGHHVVVLGVYFPGYFWTAALPFSLGVALGGGFWAWLYHRTGSIYAPWLSHLLVDAAIMAVGYSMLF